MWIVSSAIFPRRERVEVANPAGIPHEVTLSIPTREVREHSYIVWRKEKRIGIKFFPSS